MIELVSNWMEATIGELTLPVQNVQVARYLTMLTKLGLLKHLGPERSSPYQLTRRGVIQLLSELTNRQFYLPLDQFYFVYYFLKSYGDLLEQLITSDQNLFTPSLSAELRALRDPTTIVRNQLRFLEKEISKLDGRIQEAQAAAKLGEDTLERGGTVEEAISEIHRKFPYELNMRKPLPELMQDIPEQLRRWEMTSGLRYRAQHLWTPLRTYLDSNRKILMGLLPEEKLAK